MKGNKSKGKVPAKAGVYKCVIKRGDNISTRDVEFWFRGGRPHWQVARGEAIEEWK